MIRKISFCSRDCWLSSRIFKTRRPSSPEVRGLVSGFDGVEKGLAFGLQGLFPDLFEIDGIAFRLLGDGQAVLPVDRVGIKNQLCFYGFRVVEDEHAVAAHDDEFLLLEGIEPTHEDMGADAGGEFEIRHGDIGDPGMEEIAADGIDVGGFFAGKAQDDGDIVGGEGPEDVLLPADLAEAEAAGVDVLEAADVLLL